MLGQLSGQQETDCGLDFSGGERLGVVESDQTRSFVSNALEDIVDERVHDAHGTVRDTGIGVHLRLQETHGQQKRKKSLLK